MSNMYEALLQAQLQQTAQEGSSTPLDVIGACPGMRESCMEREMMDLHLHLESLLAGSPRRALQFIGSRRGEGVSTMVREYAWMATARLGKSVLIVDANRSDEGQGRYFQIKNRYGWDSVDSNDERSIDAAISRIGASNLYVSCCSSVSASVSRPSDPDRQRELFAILRRRFDLTLVDAPPVETGLDGVALARCMDGVILVVEAETTRWPVIEYAKSRIQNNGGSILGMVFNKRRNYIPEFIYSRL